jgi:hypothetical protein
MAGVRGRPTLSLRSPTPQVHGVGGRSTESGRCSKTAPPGAAVPADRKEVTDRMKSFFKRMWYSPALLLVLVYVLGAPRKWPKN